MKGLILDFLAMAFQFVCRCVKRSGKPSKVFTYRKKESDFYVGYWSNSGEFITKAEVSSEEEAQELCNLLNNHSHHS